MSSTGRSGVLTLLNDNGVPFEKTTRELHTDNDTSRKCADRFVGPTEMRGVLSLTTWPAAGPSDGVRTVSLESQIPTAA